MGSTSSLTPPSLPLHLSIIAEASGDAPEVGEAGEYFAPEQNLGPGVHEDCTLSCQGLTLFLEVPPEMCMKEAVMPYRARQHAIVSHLAEKPQQD